MDQSDAVAPSSVPFGTYGLTSIERFGLWLVRHVFSGRGTPRRVGEKLFFTRRPAFRDALIWDDKVKLRLPGVSSLKYILSDRHYDVRERDYLRANIRAGDVVADIGANIGFYTLWLAAFSTKATIIAFEPNPKMFSALEANVGLNDMTNVHLVRAAVGEATKEVSLGIDPAHPSTGSIHGTDRPQTSVAMTTLRDALAARGLTKLDVIKIDVEGYEDQALLPYLTETPKALWPRIIVMERNAHADFWEGDLVSKLCGMGYDIAEPTRGNVILKRRAA